MYFTNVELHNYGIYNGTHKMPLSNNINQRNITLIGGLNGRGKTTFHDAVLLALYGKQALGYIQEKTRSYEKFLTEHINKHATDDTTYVSVSMVLDDGTPVTVTRSWSLLPNEKLNQEISVEKNGEPDSHLGENWTYYIEEILPFGIARFFFFNNEKITQLANDSSFEQIKSSIKTALGIATIDRAIDHTDEVIRRKTKAIDAFQNSELNQSYQEINRQIDDLNERISKQIEEANDLEWKWQVKNAAAEAKEKEFWASGGDLSRNKDKIREEMRLIEQEVSAIQEEIQRKVAEASTPLFMCKDLVIQSYNSEQKYQENKTRKAIEYKLANIHERIMNVLTSFHLTQNEIDSIQQIFDDELQEYGSIKNISSHISLSASSMVLFEKLITDIFPTLKQEIDTLITNSETQENQLISLDAHLNAGDNQTLAMKLFDAMKSLEKERNLAEAEYQRAKDAIPALERQRDLLKSRRQNMIREIVEKENSNNDDARIVRYASLATQALNTFKVRLQQEKVAQLSKSITACFHRLVDKTSLVQKISVDPVTLDIRLIDLDGKEVLKSQLSAGEQQMFAVSVVWALALTSGYKAPVIIDTPMARLDSSHRSNFVTKYLPEASSQVLVLSTDEEIYGRYLDEVRDHVIDYYTLAYHEDKQCTSIEPGYFGEKQS